MLSTVHHLLLTMRAITAAADTYGTAVALPERPAAIVLFQRITPSHPPILNVDSADFPVLPAVHFSGISAQTA